MSRHDYDPRAKYRAEGLRALAVLLDEAGQRVRETGRSMRVAGGVLRLAKRKGRHIRDISTGGAIWLDAQERLVWTGPARPVEAASIETGLDAHGDATK